MVVRRCHKPFVVGATGGRAGSCSAAAGPGARRRPRAPGPP